jgi:acyl-CoA synthetase (NDP forming)
MNSPRLQTPVVDTAALLASLGIESPHRFVCATSDPATAAAVACRTIPGTRAVVKILEPFVAHKTEVGGVRVVVREEGPIAAAIEDLRLRLDATQVEIVEFIEHDDSPGGELLLAIRWTDDFGPIVTLGLGGVAAEVMSNVAVFSPAVPMDIGAVLARKSFTPLLTGFRNQRARIAKQQLEELVQHCLDFASRRLPHELSEIEVNPLVPTVRGLYALDVLMAPPRDLERTLQPARPLWKIRNLLHPRSVAVMGVSSTAVNAGRTIARNSRDRAVIVKAGEQTIDGIPCVPDLAALDPVDLLVLAIPAEQVPDVIEQATACEKAESIIVIPGGLGEYEGSENLERRVRDTLAATRSTSWRGPVVNGANCLGISSPDVNTIFLPADKVGDYSERAPLAVVSQSGALAVSLQTKMAPLAPRYVVSIGNQIDLTVGDYMQYFATDPDVDVLAFYVEGFAPLDGQRWLEAAARVVETGRSVVLYRAGRTAAGRQATSSHTASIAGDYVVTRELARAHGILFAETLDEFVDLTRVATLLRSRRPRGRRIAAMSNAGFETVTIADNLGTMELAELAPETRDAIAEVIRESRLDRIVTVANPLDVNPMLGDAAFGRLAELLLADDAVDAAVIGCIPLTGALRTLAGEIVSDQSIVKLLTTLWHRTTKPWMVVLDSGELYDPAARRLTDEGIPVFRAADRAARTLGAWSATLLRS